MSCTGLISLVLSTEADLGTCCQGARDIGGGLAITPMEPTNRRTATEAREVAGGRAVETSGGRNRRVPHLGHGDALRVARSATRAASRSAARRQGAHGGHALERPSLHRGIREVSNDAERGDCCSLKAYSTQTSVVPGVGVAEHCSFDRPSWVRRPVAHSSMTGTCAHGVIFTSTAMPAAAAESARVCRPRSRGSSAARALPRCARRAGQPEVHRRERSESSRGFDVTTTNACAASRKSASSGRLRPRRRPLPGSTRGLCGCCRFRGPARP